MYSRTIGFIGLGIMGRPMAGHLLAGGHALRVHTRTRETAAGVLSRGARWCDTPADAARGAEVLITMVTDTPDVEAVLFGPGGAAETLGRGATAVDMSTIRPDAARSIGARLARLGADFLDAPVTGGEAGARNATLTIMVGGARAAFDRVRPILELMGKRVVHVGPGGAGQTMKACNQILCGVNMMAVCEALMLARAAGLDAGQVVETLATGAGGSWALQNLGAKINAGDLQPAFMIKLMQKDLRIVQEAAAHFGLPLPATALSQQLFRAVESEPGGASLGTQAMIRAYERLRPGQS